MSIQQCVWPFPYPDLHVPVRLSPSRLYELHNRVGVGSEVVDAFHVSSAWMLEVSSPRFSVRHLAIRIREYEAYRERGGSEQFEFPQMRSFIRAVPDIAKFLDQSPADALVRYGLELEHGEAMQELQYRFLDACWKNSALFRASLITL